MTNEEFLTDVCPNHTDKSQWNKSELLHILELHKEQLRLYNVSQRSELFFAVLKWAKQADLDYPDEMLLNDFEQFTAKNCV